MSARWSLSELCIVVGTRCNFACRHCLFDLKKKRLNLTSKEIHHLQIIIQQYAPKVLSFTGGEPTLYIPDINKIVSAHPSPKKIKVLVATNGGFATTCKAAKETLASIHFLTHIQLSCDKFHSEFLPNTNIENMYKACMEMGVGFSVLLVMQSPLDLVLINKLKKIGNFKIGIQSVCDIGEAHKNSVAFNHMVFDGDVLKKFCPGRKQVSYLCGRGFSICCANLIFNDVYPQSVHATVEEHVKSNFYKIMTSTNFGELLKRFGVSKKNLLPRHSAECALCEYIFSNVNHVRKGDRKYV